MRYPVPLYTLSHHYRMPVNGIRFHTAARKIFSQDRKIIKIWNAEDGSLFSNIEPKSGVNDIELCQNTGLLFAPLEQEKIGTYFIPRLGPAPKWCAFLENLTEELEESNVTTVYDDFKFLTRADLDKLEASHLIGTPVLKAYMHGYFMEIKAYQKLAAKADPFAYEKFRQQVIENRLSKQRERI